MNENSKLLHSSNVRVLTEREAIVNTRSFRVKEEKDLSGKKSKHTFVKILLENAVGSLFFNKKGEVGKHLREEFVSEISNVISLSSLYDENKALFKNLNEQSSLFKLEEAATGMANILCGNITTMIKAQLKEDYLKAEEPVNGKEPIRSIVEQEFVKLEKNRLTKDINVLIESGAIESLLENEEDSMRKAISISALKKLLEDVNLLTNNCSTKSEQNRNASILDIVNKYSLHI
jgi:hypothetical protein